MTFLRRLSNYLLVLGLLLVFGTLYVIFDTLRPQLELSSFGSSSHPSVTDISPSSLSRNLTVHHTPMNRYKENLWPDRKYITTWGASGWTNDFMSYVILIYMAMISDRIPVIPPFSRSHHIDADFPVNFGDIYDIAALGESIRWPILQWSEVKDMETGEEESLGCWSAWQLVEPEPRSSWIPFVLNLDISYTKVPGWATLRQEKTQSVWALASLGFEAGRLASALRPAQPSPKKKVIPPDEHLFCLDYIYYAGVVRHLDMFNWDYSPGWRMIGKYAKFKPSLVSLATLRLKKHFGILRRGQLPPFIAVHMRRGDFGTWCPDEIAVEDCYGSLQAYVVRVQEVRAELLEKRGINVTRVLVTSDEDQGSPLWDDITAHGWGHIDHDLDAEVHSLGSWLSPVLDAVFHSLSIGFVGTQESTMSLMGRLRVEQWNGGVTRSVRWGSKNADDH